MLALAVLAGICTSLQGPTNTALSTHVGRAQATVVSFAGGVILLALLVLLFGQGDLSAVTQVPAWQLIAGCYGFLVIVSVVYATPRLGIAFTLMLLMFGKLAMGAVIDANGLIGVAQKGIVPMRLAGLACVAMGIILVSIGRMRHSASTGVPAGKGAKGGAASAAFLAAIAGVGNAIQAPTLTMLSANIGSLEALLWNFIVGLLCAVVYLLLSQRGRWHSLRDTGVRPWQCLGGIYGTAVATIVVATTPVLGVGLLVSAQMCGQLAGGMVVDARGWLNCDRIPVSPWRIAGVLAVAMGMLLLALV